MCDCRQWAAGQVSATSSPNPCRLRIPLSVSPLWLLPVSAAFGSRRRVAVVAGQRDSVSEVQVAQGARGVPVVAGRRDRGGTGRPAEALRLAPVQPGLADPASEIREPPQALRRARRTSCCKLWCKPEGRERQSAVGNESRRIRTRLPKSCVSASFTKRPKPQRTPRTPQKRAENRDPPLPPSRRYPTQTQPDPTGLVQTRVQTGANYSGRTGSRASAIRRRAARVCE